MDGMPSTTLTAVVDSLDAAESSILSGGVALAAALRGARRRTAGPRVTAVIPALNEAENLPRVIAHLPACVDELIVVDGCSEDGTAEAARRARPDVRVISRPPRGKGDALRAGFEAATGDIIVMLDADGSTDPREIPRFVDALLNGADFVKGSRFLKGAGSDDLTPIRRLGAATLTGAVNLLFSTGYTDLCYGYNAFWRDALERIPMTATGFEVETLMNIRAATSGLVVAEVPSIERERYTGESHLRVVRDGLRVLRTIITERFGGRARMPVMRLALETAAA
jgi:glycosyltransferase involved in cell wall biosynthesis